MAKSRNKTVQYNHIFNQNITSKQYSLEKYRLQIELLKLQEWVINSKKRVAIVFEGRDAAGKGATIKRFIEHLMPTKIQVHELGIPTPKQMKNWFGTFEKLMPKKGEIVFFDRSWYCRPLVQVAMGYCSKTQYKYFMSKVNSWEEKLIMDQDICLIKLYLSVSKNIQKIRFDMRRNSELKYWKLSENDIIAHQNWHRFTKYKEQMFNKTSTKHAPWVVINSNQKLVARLHAMRYVLKKFRYPGKVEFSTTVDIARPGQHAIEIEGVRFDNLSCDQFELLNNIKSSYE
jgi:polyphosphate kinase